MQILTKENLDAAIKKCKENDRYKVLIVTKYVGDHHYILDYLSEAGIDVVRRFNNSFARFLNGSNINLISSSSNITCGARANLVLYQEDICNECEEARYVLAAMEVYNTSFRLFNNQEVQ